MKKQGCLRCKSGPVLCKKLPVNFSKAYLLHINVNILYRRCLFSASAFSISAENPDIFVMTHCRMKAAGSLHAVRSRCRLSAVPFRHFMCPCRMGVIYKKHGFGFILPLFMVYSYGPKHSAVADSLSMSVCMQIKKKNAKRFIINHLAFFLVSLYSRSFILIRVRIKLRSCAERRRSSASAD